MFVIFKGYFCKQNFSLMKPYLEGLYVEARPEPELGRPGAGGGQHGLARGAQQQQVAQLRGLNKIKSCDTLLLIKKRDR